MGSSLTRSLPRFVNAFTAKSKRYYYFRRPGMEAIRLPDYGTPEFEKAYQSALQGEAPEIGSDRTIPGTLNEAIVSYYKSHDFRGLAASTQMMRRSYLERLRERYGNDRLATMTSAFIVKMMERMEPFAARNWFKSVRALMRYAVEVRLCARDVTQGVKPPKVNSDGIHSWTDNEIAKYESHHALGTNARLAFALAIYTGQRRADLVRMGRQHVRDGAIEVRQQKTKAVLKIPLHSELLAALDSLPGQHLTFLVTKTGRSYSPNDLSDQFRVWCDEAGLPQCSAHGLRKAAARRLAEAGCTTHEIASITGHRSLKEIERYTRAVAQAALARQAMARQENKL